MEKVTKMSSEVYVVKGAPEDVKTINVSVKVNDLFVHNETLTKKLMFVFFFSLNIDVILYSFLETL